jgi:hypothetical protein
MAKDWRRQLSKTFAITRVVLAQGGVNSAKDRLGPLLLDTSDLPDDGWSVSDERAYRTGAGRTPTEQIRRARKMGSVTVIRRLKSDSSSRMLSLALIPLASEADAVDSVRDSITRAIRKPFSDIEETSEGFVEGPIVPMLPNAMLYELRYVKPELGGGERIVAGVIDHFVIQLNFRDPRAMWPWSDVAAISTLQVDKLQAAISQDMQYGD